MILKILKMLPRIQKWWKKCSILNLNRILCHILNFPYSQFSKKSQNWQFLKKEYLSQIIFSHFRFFKRNYGCTLIRNKALKVRKRHKFITWLRYDTFYLTSSYSSRRVIRSFNCRHWQCFASCNVLYLKILVLRSEIFFACPSNRLVAFSLIFVLFYYYLPTLLITTTSSYLTLPSFQIFAPSSN